MKFNKTSIDGLLIIEPDIFTDERGHFMEAYNFAAFCEEGITDEFVQDNEALSKKGVLRGMHYQVEDMAQSKLVRVTRGVVYDVAVDIREGSETYGQWVGVELSAENKKLFYIPRGFAHGYLALEDNTVFSYKCDNFYSKEHEGGIRFDDAEIAIEWPLNGMTPIVSARDLGLEAFSTHRKP